MFISDMVALIQIWRVPTKAGSKLIAWVGFFTAMAAVLAISQRNLGVAMFVGALILGVTTIPERLPSVLWSTVTDQSTIILALIVGLIPVIGGTLKASGQMDNLVSNMRIGKRAFLMLSPALVGLLPMPGGALLSAPLIENGGGEIPNAKKAGLNVWFRHVLYLVYPLSSDHIVSTEAACLGVYQPIPYLVPMLLLSLCIGYIFFLRDVAGERDYKGGFSMINLLLPLTAILIAPILDVLIKASFALIVEEIATLIGVSVSLLIAVAIGRVRPKKFFEILLKARPWNFAAMLMGIMVFLDVFKSSGVSQLVGSIGVTPQILFVVGFLLGFGTGRITTPAGIVFPIFLAKFGAISLPVFALMYFGIFLGYVMTPVHPCVSLSIESFKTNTRDYFKAVALPTSIALLISFSLLHALNP